jgi:hypothetical protein
MLTIRSAVAPAAAAAMFMALTLALDVAASAEDAARSTRSAQGFEAERGTAERRSLLVEDALPEASRKPRTSVKQAAETRLQSTQGPDTWVYDATAELFSDRDGDGYYHYLRVRFDVDTAYAGRWVFARLFLSDDGEWWEEYHVTRDFFVEGSSPYDDYEVETELAAGYPPGLYDVLIEIYDADYGDFLAEFGPADTSALALLPLEDVDRDRPPVVVVHEHGGGGSVGSVTLGFLAALALLALRRRRAPNLASLRIRSQD